MKKKIFILSPSYPSASDSVQSIFVQDQARVLSRDYFVCVAVPEMRGWRKLDSFLADSPFQDDYDGDIHIFRDCQFARLPFSSSSVSSALFRSAESSFIRFRMLFGLPQLIAAHFTLPSGYVGALLSKKYNVPLVIHEHASMFSDFLQNPHSRKWVRFSFQQASEIISVSPFSASVLQEHFPKGPIKVVGNIVDTDFFTFDQTKVTDDKTTFVSIGRLADQKGLVFLLQAVAILHKQGYTSFLVHIIGSGPLLGSLQQLAAGLHISHLCKFHGTLKRLQIVPFLEKATAFIQASLHESFCITLAEALSSGVPVISTRSGGPEYFVNSSNGVLVDKADSVALASAMSLFIDRKISFDPSILRSDVVSRFGADSIVRQIADIYEPIIEHGRTQRYNHTSHLNQVAKSV
jgi:glycosyltransferase involved in cell wall biosynthesis